MTKLISIAPFKSDVIVHFGSQEELQKELSEYFQEHEVIQIMIEMVDLFNEETNVVGMSMVYKDKSIIAMSHIPSTAGDFGVMVHEIYHAVNGLVGKIGSTFSSEAEEVYAYLIEYLTERIISTFGLSLQQSCEDVS